jgi:hypothetical protein
VHTSGFKAQGIIHISSAMMEEEDKRARGKRPIRSCRKVGGGGDELQVVSGCCGGDSWGHSTLRTCRENGSDEFVMMRRLRMELT